MALAAGRDRRLDRSAAFQCRPELYLVGPLVTTEHGLGRPPAPEFAEHLERLVHEVGCEFAPQRVPSRVRAWVPTGPQDRAGSTNSSLRGVWVRVESGPRRRGTGVALGHDGLPVALVAREVGDREAGELATGGWSSLFRAMPGEACSAAPPRGWLTLLRFVSQHTQC